MGKILEADAFLNELGQLYSRTKKWGAVRVTLKRVFKENFKHKKSKRKERVEDKRSQCENLEAQYTVAVKAKTSRKRITTLVEPVNCNSFKKSLSDLMSSNMFAQQQLDTKKKKRDKKGEEKKAVKATEESPKKALPEKEGKKNRKERRKDLRKDKRKRLK